MESTNLRRDGSRQRRPARFASVIVEELANLIIGGTYAEGDVLPTEPALCDEFGFSRTVVREGLKLLEERGIVHFAVAARQAVTDEMRELAEDIGDDRVRLDKPTEATLVGRFSPRTRVAEGDRVEVAVDRRALHFFDAQTGLAIRSA